MKGIHLSLCLKGHRLFIFNHLPYSLRTEQHTNGQRADVCLPACLREWIMELVFQYIWQYHSKSYDNHHAYSSVNGAAICTMQSWCHLAGAKKISQTQKKKKVKQSHYHDQSSITWLRSVCRNMQINQYADKPLCQSKLSPLEQNH